MCMCVLQVIGYSAVFAYIGLVRRKYLRNKAAEPENLLYNDIILYSVYSPGHTCIIYE
jgi:hypothetical protein